MAGFAAGLGGAGQEATQLGAQIRPILERQREGYAALLGKQAEEEGNPDYRNQLLKLSADAISGVPLNKIMPAHQKLIQSMQMDHQLLGQHAQSLAPQQGQPTPGAGSGIPGGYSQLLGGAAQPQTSPVSPQAQGAAKPQEIPGVGQMSTVPVEQPPELQGGVPANIPISEPPAVKQAAQATQGGTQEQQIPPVMVTPQAQPIEPGSRTREIVQRYLPLIQQATPAMRPQLQDMMNKELGAIAPLEKQALAMSEYKALQAEPGFSAGMMDFPKMSAAFQAHGFQPPPFGMGMMNAMFTPIHMGGMSGSTVWQNWPDIAKEHNIPNSNNPVDVWINKITQQPVLIGGKAVRNNILQGQDQQGNPVMMEASPYGPQGAIQPIGGATATPPSMNTPRSMGVGPGNRGEIASMNQLNAGNVTLEPGQVASTLPVNRSLTQTPTGSTGTTVKGIQNPAAPAPTGPGDLNLPPHNGFPGMNLTPTEQGATAPPVIKKIVTAQQAKTAEQSVNIYDQTIKRIQDVRSELPLIKNLITAGKIQLAISPSTGALIASRIYGLNPEEAKLAADFQALSEDINSLRKPLGQVSKGKEAFEKLQAQAGQIMANPDVTDRVLENTLNMYMSIRNPEARMIGMPEIPAAGGVQEIQPNDRTSYEKLPSGTHYKVGGVEYIKR